MIDNNLVMTPIPDSLLYVYDQNFNLLGASVECFHKHYEDEIITRSKGKEVLTFEAVETSAIYQYLKTENVVKFGERWFRIKFAEDDSSAKGLTKFTCYALWYELAEGLPTPIRMVGSTVRAVAEAITKDFGKWVKLVIPTDSGNRPVRSITLKENSGLYKLRYLAKQYNMELTFGYEEVFEQELRYVKTVVIIQQYTESKIDYPLVVEENLNHIVRAEDSRNLCTAYKLTGKGENDDEELTFASINHGSDYLIDVSWFTERQMRPRYIPKSKHDDRFKIKQSMLDAARAYLDVYAKPLVTYEASAILYDKVPDLHHSQLVVDDFYKLNEWRKVTARSVDYDDLSNSQITFDDPRRDLMDLINDDGDGAISSGNEEQSHVVIRYANDILGTGFNTENGKYIGVLTTTKRSEDLKPDDFTWVKIEGPEGKQGRNGEPGTPGRDGVDGVAGKDGVGIVDTDITYCISLSGTQAPTDGWSSQVPELVKGRYLWTKTFWRYSDGTHETGYSVTYIAQDGNKGDDGIAGKDGVGIKNTEITYATSAFGTTPPENGWSTSIPQVAPAYYLWTRTKWFYTDDTTEVGYSVARMGTRGPKGDSGSDGLPGKNGVGLKGTEVVYGLSDNDQSAPTTWTQQVPSLVKGKFLWTRTTWTYTDTTSETAYQKTYIARDGNDGQNGIAGKDGVGLHHTDITYAGSTSGTVPPSGDVLINYAKVIRPSRSSTDNIDYPELYFDAVNGAKYKLYGISSNGQFASQHLSREESNRVVIWGVQLDTPGGSTFKIISNENTGVHGNEFTWTGPTGRTRIRVNTYKPDNSTQVEYLRLESADSSIWSTAIPQVQPGFYLWTRTIWTYTDGTSETGYSVTKIGEQGPRGIQVLQGETGQQGIPGTPGPDGRSQFTHIAFSDSPDGTGFSHTDQGRAYIGLYQDYNEAHSKDKASYRWTKWAVRDGAQGIPGKEGANGNTSYFHVAYAGSADGTRAFSLDDRNQQYIGYYSDSIIQDSTDPKKYRWFDRMANVQVGGVNLFLNSLFTFGLKEPYSTYRVSDSTDETKGQLVVSIDTTTKYRGYNTLKLDSTWNGKYENQRITINVGGDSRVPNEYGFTNQNVRISFWGKSNKANARIDFRTEYRGTVEPLYLTTDWKYYSTYLCLAEATKSSQQVIIHLLSQETTAWLTMIKVEVGTLSTSHTEAPEDIAYRINSKADGKLTQDQLNALAEKSQIYEAELAAKATMEQLSDLEKAYEARIKATEEAISKSEADLIDAGRRIEATVAELGGLRELKKFIDTYMSSSNEGLIIGKNDASATIKVSPDRISMFSAGKEVMYISQGVIHIDNGVFTKSLQIGRFITEQHYADPDLNVCRYVG